MPDVSDLIVNPVQPGPPEPEQPGPTVERAKQQGLLPDYAGSAREADALARAWELATMSPQARAQQDAYGSLGTWGAPTPTISSPTGKPAGYRSAYAFGGTAAYGPMPPEREIQTMLIAAMAYDPWRWDDSPETRQTMIRMLRLAQSNPEILNLADQNISAAAAVSEAVWFGMSMLPDGPARQNQLFAHFLEAADTVLAQYESYFVTPEREAQKGQRWNELNLELSRVQQPFEARQFSNLTPEEVEYRAYPEYRESLRIGSQHTLFIVTSAWNTRPLRAALSDNNSRLLIAVADPRSPEDTEETWTQLVDIRLDPGTRIKSSLDVLEAMVDVVQGNAHKLGPYSADPETLGQPRYNPVRWVGQTIDAVGRAWDNTNAAWNWSVSRGQELWQTYGPGGDGHYDLAGASADFASSTTIQAQRREQALEQARQEAIRSATSDIGIVSLAAAELYEQNRDAGIFAAVGGAEQQVYALGPEIEAVREEMAADMTGSDLDARILATMPDQESGLKNFGDKTLQLGLEGLALYGHLLDWSAVHLLQTAGNVGQAFADMVGLGEGVWGGEPGITNPWDAFKNTWDWTSESRLSEYWGLDPNGTGLLVDVIANVAVDPLTWVTLGAAAGQRQAFRLLTDASLAPKLLNKPTTRLLARQVNRALQRGDEGILTVYSLTRGMADRHKMMLLGARSEQEVLDIFRQAIPSGGGTWLLDVSGHTVTRNTALLVERLSRVGGIDSGVGDRLAKMLGGFSKHRALSVAEGHFTDEFVDLATQLFRNDRAAAGRWIKEMNKVVSDGYLESGVPLLLSRDQIEAVSRAIRQLRLAPPAELSALIRRMGYKVTASTDISKILDDLADAAKRVTALDDEIRYLEGRIAAEAGPLTEPLYRGIGDVTLESLPPNLRTRLEAVIAGGKDETLAQDLLAELANREGGLGTFWTTSEQHAQTIAQIKDGDFVVAIRPMPKSAVDERAMAADLEAVQTENQVNLLPNQGMEVTQIQYQGMPLMTGGTLRVGPQPTGPLYAELGTRQAERAAISTGRWSELQRIEAEMRQIRGTYAISPAAKAAGKKPPIPDDVRIRLIDLNAQRARLLKDPMLRGVQLGDDEIRKIISRHQDYMDELRQLNRKREQARAGARTASRGNIRDQYANLLARMVDEYGETVLGLERIAGKVDPFTGKEPLRWSDVTGSKRLPHEDDAERLWPLIYDASKDEIDEVVRGRIAGSGFYDRRSVYHLPTTPQKMIAYEMRKHGGPVQRALAAQVLGAESSVGRVLQATALGMQRVWATILLVPRIAFRSGTDETMRWAATTGRLTGGKRATLMGQAIEEQRRMPGPLGATFTQFGPRRQFGDRTTMAMRQSFSQVPFIQGHDPSAWRLVGRKTNKAMDIVGSRRLHRDATIRWVNGTFLEDEATKAFAQSVLDTARVTGKTPWEVMTTLDVGSWDLGAFSRWWQEGTLGGVPGKMRSRTERYSKAGLNLGGMRDGVRGINTGTVLLAERADEPATVAEWLIGKAAKGEKVGDTPADERVVRLFGPMPTDALGATSSNAAFLAGSAARLQDRMFEYLFGNPGQNRFGWIHADMYDRALSILEEAHRGRMLTPEMLWQPKAAGGLGLVDTPEEAALLFNRNVERINQIAREHNLMTTQMVEAAADSYARNQALHLMYQPGATSMLGLATQRYLVPFGPAQYDFMSWWLNHATKAATVGAFGHYAQIPNFLKPSFYTGVVKGFGEGRAAGGVMGGLRGAAEGARAAGALPLNLRFLARAGELGAIQQKSLEALEARGGKPREGADWLDRLISLTPTDLIEELTFLPRIDNFENLMLDLGPAVGPIPAWVIRLLPDPTTVTDESSLTARVLAGFRGYAESVMPAIEWGDQSGLSLESLAKAMFPDYEGSARDLLELLGKLTMKAIRGGTGEQVGGTSFMYRDSLDAVLADRLSQRTGFLPFGDDTDEYNEWIADVQREAEAKAWGQDWQVSLAKAMPFSRLLWSPDDMATPMWEGFVAELPTLLGYAAIGQSTVTNINNLWAEYKAGTLTYEKQRELHDALRTALFGLSNLPNGELVQAWLLVRNPELAVPMTGRYEAAVGDNGLYRGPADSYTADGRPLLPAGQEGLDKLKAGLELGWYVEKDPDQRMREINYRLAQAQRTILRNTYTQLTGRDWPPSNATDAMRAHTYTITAALREALLLAGASADDLKPQMTGAELFDSPTGLFSNLGARLAAVPYPRDTKNGIRAALQADPWGAQMLYDLDKLGRELEDQGYSHPSDWPEEWLQPIRADFQKAVDQQLITADEYAREFQRLYGPLNYAPPVPPPLADLPEGSAVFRVGDPDDLFVIDGDTVDLLLADATTRRFRLIGVNAPDDPMPGAAEAFDDLMSLLKNEGYQDIALVVWDAERFGITAGTDFRNNQQRYKAWLYVNGQPVYNPRVFTHSNPLGIGSGGEFVRLPRPAATVTTGVEL